ncbi:patatin-like phospholipase family protein [Thiotrichales bacterium 19S3-7]|nr:patatin-like phospholipase family protein [Thiotrichales bacterium 19S3-7]
MSIIQLLNTYYSYDKELILLNSTAKTRSNTHHWIKEINYFRHHHIQFDDPNSLTRCVRFLSGQARALVLSGGGGRGWTHIGALYAFSENKIDFDLVGGTSVGAIIAALYATGKPIEELVMLLQK